MTDDPLTDNACPECGGVYAHTKRCSRRAKGSTAQIIAPAPRDSERAMTEVAREMPPRQRRTDPTGGPGHPFEGGTITLMLSWDGTRMLALNKGREDVQHELLQHDLIRLDDLCMQIRGIVYVAQWRAAQPREEPSDVSDET